MRPCSRRRLVAGCILGVSALGSAQDDPGDWLRRRVGRSIGPPGGEVRALAAAPTDARRLYAGTASGHLFISQDGAGSWEDARAPLPREAVIHRVAVDPRSADLAYVAAWLPGGGGRLLRTADAGKTWTPLALPGEPALRTVAIAPSDPTVLYAGGPEGVWRSEDGGRSWLVAAGETETPRLVESLAVDPRDPRHVYAGTWRQAYRSRDGGRRWEKLGQGMPVDRDVFCIALHPSDPDHLVAGTCGFLYTSSDGGGRWLPSQRGVASDHRRIHAVAVSPVDPAEIWAGTRGGIYRSTDRARSFELVRGDVAVFGFALDAGKGQVCAGTEELGVLCRQAGGPFRESNLGLDASRVTALEARADGFQILYAAREERPRLHSLHLSSNSGRSWSRLAGATLFAGVRFLRAVDLPAPQLLVILEDGRWTRIGASPAVENLISPPGRLAAVEVAARRGVALAATDTGLYYAPVERLAIPSRRSLVAPPGPWQRVHAGPLAALDLDGDRYVAIGPAVVLRGRISLLLAGLRPTDVKARGLSEGTRAVALGPEGSSVLHAAGAERIQVSKDHGASWETVELPWPAHELLALETLPPSRERVLALDRRGSLFRGDGAGRHWRVFDSDPWLDQAVDLRLSAAVPDLALVATLGHGVRVVSLVER